MSTHTFHVKAAKNLIDKSVGLLKYDKPISLLFITRWGIHTFGMKYSIDVLILDDNGQVKTLKAQLKSNRIWMWNPRYSHVVEMEAGSIQKMQIKKNDYVRLVIDNG